MLQSKHIPNSTIFLVATFEMQSLFSLTKLIVYFIAKSSNRNVNFHFIWNVVQNLIRNQYFYNLLNYEQHENNYANIIGQPTWRRIQKPNQDIDHPSQGGTNEWLEIKKENNEMTLSLLCLRLSNIYFFFSHFVRVYFFIRVQHEIK